MYNLAIPPLTCRFAPAWAVVLAALAASFFGTAARSGLLRLLAQNVDE